EREAGEAEHDEGDARHGTDAMVHGSSSGSGVRRSPPPGVETGPHPGGPRVSTGDTTGDTAVRSRRTCPDEVVRMETASFGAWVRRRRVTLDLTQAELARRVACAPITIRKIEADERRPSKVMAERLAEALELD